MDENLEMMHKGETGGFESLAHSSDSYARVHAVEHGFKKLSRETIAALEHDKYSHVRWAVGAAKMNQLLMSETLTQEDSATAVAASA